MESKPQPVIRLKIDSNKIEYDHINFPYSHVKSTNVTPINKTRAKSSLMGMKTFKKYRFQESTKCMQATMKASPSEEQYSPGRLATINSMIELRQLKRWFI